MEPRHKGKAKEEGFFRAAMLWAANSLGRGCNSGFGTQRGKIKKKGMKCCMTVFVVDNHLKAFSSVANFRNASMG